MCFNVSMLISRVLVQKPKSQNVVFWHWGGMRRLVPRGFTLAIAPEAPPGLWWAQNGPWLRGVNYGNLPVFQFSTPLTLLLVLGGPKQIDTCRKNWQHPWLMEKVGGKNFLDGSQIKAISEAVFGLHRKKSSPLDRVNPSELMHFGPYTTPQYLKSTAI